MPQLFDALTMGPVTLPNRVAIAPMCQYSADDGCASDWHIAQWTSYGLSRAGLVIVEATGVERSGRISHGDLGIYSDACEAAMARVLAVGRRNSDPATKWGIQLAHAGRKGSAQRPWEGGGPLGAHQDPWPTSAPSAIAFHDGWHTPQALDEAGVARVIDLFVAAAKRAVRVGFEVLELHGAHGYLLHEFFSPLSNKRTDQWGGSLENRMRLILAIARAVKAAVPAHIAVGARITGSDWMEGGVTPDDTVALAKALRAEGIAYACVTSGGLVATAKIPQVANYQVPFAEKVRRESGIVTRAVGLIAEAHQADEIISTGKADQVAIARAMLDDPRWVWHAAEKLGAKLNFPPQMERAGMKLWPGAQIARPPAKV